MKPAYTARSTVLLLGLLSAGALAFAIVAQKGFGYAPCELCMIQRYWHGAVVGAAVLMVLTQRPRLFLALQAIALFGCFGYSVFHAGVELHWWEGTRACIGQTGAATTEELLKQILSAPVVRCDEIRWSVLGLSMAVWDAILTGSMLAFALFTLVRKK